MPTTPQAIAGPATPTLGIAPSTSYPGTSTIPDLGITGGPSTLASIDELLNQLNLSGQTAANAGALSGQANADAQALADQILANNAQAFPGAAGLQGQASTDIASQLAGTLPQDVVNQLSTQAAERGVSTGDPGGANNTAALLQALGLTSLSQVNQGESALNTALASNRVENPVAPVGIAPVGIAPITNPQGILYPPGAGSSGGAVYPSGSNPSGSNPAAPTLPNLFPGLVPAAGGATNPLMNNSYGLNPANPNQTATTGGVANPATGTPAGSIAAQYPGNPGSDYGLTGYYSGTPAAPDGSTAAAPDGSITAQYPGNPGSDYGVTGYTDPTTGQPVDPYTGLPVDFNLSNSLAANTGQPVDPYTGLPVDTSGGGINLPAPAGGTWNFNLPLSGDTTTGGGINLPAPVTGGPDTTVINGVSYDTSTGQPVPGLQTPAQLQSTLDANSSDLYYAY